MAEPLKNEAESTVELSCRRGVMLVNSEPPLPIREDKLLLKELLLREEALNDPGVVLVLGGPIITG